VLPDTGQDLALASTLGEELSLATGGYELVVGGSEDGDGGKVLGHRHFARYYRQKYRADDPRRSVTVNKVLSKYGP
jgi:pre-60S factor REI1